MQHSMINKVLSWLAWYKGLFGRSTLVLTVPLFNGMFSLNPLLTPRDTFCCCCWTDVLDATFLGSIYWYCWFFFRIFHSQTGHNSLSMSEVIVSIINEDLGIEKGESSQRNQCSGKKSKPHAIVGDVTVRPSVSSISANWIKRYWVRLLS